MGELPAQPDQTAGLNRLPLAALILAPDGSAIAVNEAWAELAGVSGAASRGGGWMQGLDPRQRRPLRARLRAAAATGARGFADCQLGDPGQRQWSRWWWQARPAGGVVVCVAGIKAPDPDRVINPDPEPGQSGDGRDWGDERDRHDRGDGRDERDERHGPPAARPPPGPPDLDARIEVTGTVIHRIFGVGLTLESAIGLLGAGPAQAQIQQAIQELDELIRDIRNHALALPRRAGGLSGDSPSVS